MCPYPVKITINRSASLDTKTAVQERKTRLQGQN